MEKLQLCSQQWLPPVPAWGAKGCHCSLSISQHVWGLAWDTRTHGTFQVKLQRDANKSVPGWPSVI